MDPTPIARPGYYSSFLFVGENKKKFNFSKNILVLCSTFIVFVFRFLVVLAGYTMYVNACAKTPVLTIRLKHALFLPFS